MRWLLASILLAAALPLAAQTSAPVQLELKCGKTPCSFQMGEVIPVELSFTASVPKRYQLNMASYDRSGRMNCEMFRVTPQEGAHDPLREYFAFGGLIMGGLTNFQFLGAEPVTIKLVMNEWVSFERPGAYRVKVSSSRVNEDGNIAIITSNEIELEVLPADTEWQQRELQRVVQALDHPRIESAARGSVGDPLVALRYLGTEAAALELARRLGAGDTNADFQCMLGPILFT